MPLMLVSRSERNPICLVSLDPIFYSSYHSLYTITEKNEQMNKILRSFKEENIIKEEDVKDISNEKEPKNLKNLFWELARKDSKDMSKNCKISNYIVSLNYLLHGF